MTKLKKERPLMFETALESFKALIVRERHIEVHSPEKSSEVGKLAEQSTMTIVETSTNACP